MSYIYLSYAKADRDSAFAMRDVLNKEGFRVWMDENQRDLSILYWPQIQKNINNAGLFVVLASDAAQNSKWLKRELDYAETIQKPIRAFVIQGEGWERLNPYLTPLTLGLRLDVPLEAANEIKTVLYASKDNLLPKQIPSDAIGQYTIWAIIAICVSVSALILLNRFAPIAQDFLQNGIVMLAPSPAPLTTRQVLEATSAASIQTRSYENAQGTIVFGTATADAITTYQAEMYLTAIARGGVLPCEAELQTDQRFLSVTFYNSPSINDFKWSLTVSANEHLVLTEWVERYSTSWYRVENQDGIDYGYVQAQRLVLDEDCPR